MISNLNLTEATEEQAKRIGFEENPEKIYAQMLTAPFATTESGGRGLISGHQFSQSISFVNPEPLIIGVGWESSFTDRSASVLQADDNYIIMDKIYKFEDNINNYYLIVIKEDSGELDVIERKEMEYVSETYGYKYNNKFIDSIDVGYVIDKGSIIRKSNSMDDYMNSQTGTNILTGYINDDYNTEDAQIISETGSSILATNLFHKISIIKNSNDIFLNKYGNDKVYKSFPDINETVNNGILLASRKSIIKESPYMQSNDRLREIMMSDEKITITGNCKVVDINIYVNDPMRLANEHYNVQLLKYYYNNMRFLQEFVDVVSQYIGKYKFSYKISKMYNEYLKILSGKEFIKDKKFSDVLIEFFLIQEKNAEVGDKYADRFGGKGVISRIIPDDQMPKMPDGRIIHFIKNPATMHNRENGGQCYELSINSLSDKVLQNINSGCYTSEEMFDLIIEYIRAIVPSQADYIMESFNINGMDDSCIPMIQEAKDIFVQELIDSKRIPLRLRPIRDSINIDKLGELIDKFTGDNQTTVRSPIRDSNGNIRYVQGRRKLTVGFSYIYALKQYGEEKWSVTSLSSTNIKNENSRNKANTDYKALHSATPIKQGDMEAGDLDHLGAEVLIINLMLLSLSPHGRRKAQDLLTEDPYDIDIRLDSNAKNRSVEIINAYLKAMGLEFEFIKKKKQLRPGIVVYEKKQRECIKIKNLDNTSKLEKGELRDAISIRIKGENSNDSKRDDNRTT